MRGSGLLGVLQWLKLAPIAAAALLGSALGPALGIEVAARAASIDSAMDEVDLVASDLAARATTLELDTRPGAYLSATAAVARFQDYLFLHLIGEHQPAAEGFFALVTTGVLSDAGLHRDAEWYLAEALVGLENFKTAASRFRVIVDDPTHPFRDDAVRRLLELYAMSGAKADFTALYESEIASGKVTPTGLITYSLAKSFYQQEDLINAISYFDQVPEDNAWYGRARYFLGTIRVRQGDLEGAVVEFERVSELSITTTEDRMVHDLALLALGRISYHNADWFAASEFYNRISGDSHYQADKLYEIIWTSIRRRKWSDALNNVEIFLLAYPEHEYSAQLRLLHGHLNFQERNWGSALGAYEQVITEYQPVQARFEGLARPGSAAQDAAYAVLEAPDDPNDLPEYAVSMMRSDPELSRAMAVFRDLNRERRDIEASERLIEELQSFISGSGAIGSYERTRTETLEARMQALDSRLALLALEERWLRSLDGVSKSDTAPMAQQQQLLVSQADRIRATVAAASGALRSFEQQMGELHADADNARREAAEIGERADKARADLNSETLDEAGRVKLLEKIDRLVAEEQAARDRYEAADRRMAELTSPRSIEVVDIAGMSTLAADIEQLAARMHAVRPGRPGLVFGDRAVATDRTLADAYARLTGVSDAIAKTEGSEVEGIRSRFEDEVSAVAQQRADHGVLLDAARAVSLDITRKGFGRLEDFFAGSILKADMGIVDVFWAEQLEIADELDRMRKERNAQMGELKRRFTLIREKMGERK